MIGEIMNFISSYKTLEKLCSDIYGDNHGISTYIDEMQNRPRGSYLVRGWDDDLKQLKHYRWVRNQIVHEPDCSEDNMCDVGDAEWIDTFYSRIMDQTDPLAMYRKATAPRPAAKPVQRNQAAQPQYTYPAQHYQPKKTSNKSIGWIVFIIIAVIIGLVFALKYFLT